MRPLSALFQSAKLTEYHGLASRGDNFVKLIEGRADCLGLSSPIPNEKARDHPGLCRLENAVT
jgi:hypothetical protein